MTTTVTTLPEYRRKLATNRLGLWLFILSDAFVFAGLFVSRFFLLGFYTRPELNQILGLVITVVLLASSFFMNRAETAMAYGDRKGYLPRRFDHLDSGRDLPDRRGGGGVADRAVLPIGWRGCIDFLYYDRFSCFSCPHRRDFPGDCLSQWAEGFVLSGAHVGGRGCGDLLAFCRCRMDLLLPRTVLDG